MYRCEICANVSQPRQPMLRHVVERQRPQGTEIARELAVCIRCHAELKTRGLPGLIQKYASASVREHRLKRDERHESSVAEIKLSRPKVLIPTVRVRAGKGEPEDSTADELTPPPVINIFDRRVPKPS